jgi:hypothetical protein
LLLPRLEAHAQFFFARLKCPGKKEDAIGETIAVAWRWFLCLEEKGKDVNEFISVLASYAARHVRAGRKLCGMEKTKDVLSPLAQTKRCFTVSKLPHLSTLTGTPLEEALHDNTRSPVPDQVAFRCDFPRWRSSRCDRDRRLIDELMLGERTLDIARRHRLTPGRISQLRRELHADWQRFCGDLDAAKEDQ